MNEAKNTLLVADVHMVDLSMELSENLPLMYSTSSVLLVPEMYG